MLSPTKLHAVAPWIVALALAGAGCHGCTHKPIGVGKHSIVPALWTAPRCGAGKPCPAADDACPQGYACSTVDNMGGPKEHVCQCQSVWGAPCIVGDDCVRSARCDAPLMNCDRMPGSRVGTCECRGECDETHPCPEGSYCFMFPWGDRGFCHANADGGTR